MFYNPRMPKSTQDFLCIETIHYATISWWWTDKSLHDTDYHIKVCDSMHHKAKGLEQEYDVQVDTRFCTQFEGIQLMGTSLEDVQEAGKKLALHLLRWRDIVAI